MRQPNFDKIEIQEPPVQKIKKRRSCLRGTCSTGCGCLVLIIIILILLLKFVASPIEKKLDTIPEQVIDYVPIYDQENIDRVVFISGKSQSYIMDILTYIPKMALVPIVAVLDINLPTDKPIHPEVAQRMNRWESAYTLVSSLKAETRDIIIVQWSDLQAESDFIEDFYKTELRKRKFKIISSKKDNVSFIEFSDKNLDGILEIVDDKSAGTDQVTLKIYLPTQ